MKNKQTAALIFALFAFSFITISACGGMMHRVEKPAADQFGLGPRTSKQNRYTATIEQPDQPLKPRKMLKVEVTILDTAGQPVENAAIEVDGGMPQHGHGLPTKPRVTRSLGNGRYEIEGLRFNMGGWWELHLDVTSTAGADRITFNLQV